VKVNDGYPYPNSTEMKVVSAYSSTRKLLPADNNKTYGTDMQYTYVDQRKWYDVVASGFPIPH